MSESLEDAIATLKILQSMYPLPTELVLSPLTTSFLSNTNPSSSDLPDDLECSLNLLLDAHPELTFTISISLPVKLDKRLVMIPRQPDWLSRTNFDTLLTDQVFLLIDHLRSTALSLLQQTQPHNQIIDPHQDSDAKGIEEERVWYWFPSLSSREKRRDLVEYAPSFGLTGFILAGTLDDPEVLGGCISCGILAKH